MKESISSRISRFLVQGAVINPEYYFIDRVIAPQYPPLVLESISAGLFIFSYVLDTHSSMLVFTDPDTTDLAVEQNLWLPDHPSKQDFLNTKQLTLQSGALTFCIMYPSLGIAISNARLATAINTYTNYFKAKWDSRDGNS